MPNRPSLIVLCVGLLLAGFGVGAVVFGSSSEDPEIEAVETGGSDAGAAEEDRSAFIEFCDTEYNVDQNSSNPTTPGECVPYYEWKDEVGLLTNSSEYPGYVPPGFAASRAEALGSKPPTLDADSECGEGEYFDSVQGTCVAQNGIGDVPGSCADGEIMSGGYCVPEDEAGNPGYLP